MTVMAKQVQQVIVYDNFYRIDGVLWSRFVTEHREQGSRGAGEQGSRGEEVRSNDQ
jgi:hypothetical protein